MRISSILIINLFFILSASIYILGCAVEPVKTEIPISHPANPQATETIYTAVPNPFEDSMPMSGMKPSESTSATHKMHKMSDVKGSGDDQNDGKTDSESSNEKANKKHGHQHKEADQ